MDLSWPGGDVGAHVAAAAEADLVAVVLLFVERDDGPAAPADRTPPPSFEAAAVRILLVGHRDPLVDVAVHVVGAGPRHAREALADLVSLIEARDLRGALRCLEALVVVVEA